MFKMKHLLMNELDEHGGDGGTGSPNEPNSILAGGGFKNEEKPLVNDENKEEGKEEKQGSDGYDWLPEKFRVQTSDGLELDLKASAEKMAASYDGLSKRMGTGDIPPKSAEEYDLKIESETLNFDDFKKDPENQAFLSKAHEQGMTTKQLEFVLNEYARVLPEAFKQFKGLTEEQATAELSEIWKTEQEFKANINDAYAAFNKYASPADKERMEEIGNNPIVIRLLANMGKSLREDSPAVNNTGVTPETVESIMRSEAYRDPNHPEHKAAHGKVRQYYESNYN